MERLRSQISRRPVGFRIMNLVFQAIDARLEYLRGLDTANHTPSPVDDAAGTGSEAPDGSPSPHLATEGDSSHVSDAGVPSTGPPDAQVDSTTDVRQAAAPQTTRHRTPSSTSSTPEAMALDSASAPEPGRQITEA